MAKEKKNHCFVHFIDGKLENKAFHDVGPSFPCKIVLQWLVVLRVFLNLDHLVLEGFAQYRILVTQFIDYRGGI